MNKDQMLARIMEIVAGCDGHVEARIEPEGALNGALTLMGAAYGSNSEHIRTLLSRRDSAAKQATNAHVYKITVTTAVKGALENLRREVEAGLLTSVERRITSDLLGDIVQLSRAALDEQGEGQKNVAAVLAAAAYEDTLRRIASERAGIVAREKLETIIGKLRDAKLLVSPQLGIVQGYLAFRNHALHAEWDKIDRTSVVSALALVEELLLKHFSQT